MCNIIVGDLEIEVGGYHLDGGGGMNPPELALLAVLEGPKPSSFCKLCGERERERETIK